MGAREIQVKIRLWFQCVPNPLIRRLLLLLLLLLLLRANVLPCSSSMPQCLNLTAQLHRPAGSNLTCLNANQLTWCNLQHKLLKSHIACSRLYRGYIVFIVAHAVADLPCAVIKPIYPTESSPGSPFIVHRFCRVFVSSRWKIWGSCNVPSNRSGVKYCGKP